MDPVLEYETRAKIRRERRRLRRRALARGSVALAIMIALIPLVSLERDAGPWRTVDLLADYDPLARLAGMCREGDLYGGVCGLVGAAGATELRGAGRDEPLGFAPSRRAGAGGVQRDGGLPTLYLDPDQGAGALVPRGSHRLPFAAAGLPPFATSSGSHGGGVVAFFDDDSDGRGGRGGGGGGGAPPGNPVPEPGAALLFALGLVALQRAARAGGAR